MQECLVFLQFANPDVAEADGRTGVAVALQKYRTCAMLYHTRKADVFGCTVDTCVVLQKHAVLEYCYIRIGTICTVFLENGSGVDYIIYIPFARFAHCVCKGCCLLVDASCLAVNISLVVVIVEHLHFVHALKVHAAVAA